jgi:hypothetical protein
MLNREHFKRALKAIHFHTLELDVINGDKCDVISSRGTAFATVLLQVLELSS